MNNQVCIKEYSIKNVSKTSTYKYILLSIICVCKRERERIYVEASSEIYTYSDCFYDVHPPIIKTKNYIFFFYIQFSKINISIEFWFSTYVPYPSMSWAIIALHKFLSPVAFSNVCFFNICPILLSTHWSGRWPTTYPALFAWNMCCVKFSNWPKVTK